MSTLNTQRIFQYSRDDLLSLKDTIGAQTLPLDLLTLHFDILICNKRRRKRGRKGGVRARTKRRGNKLHLPSIILGNVQSLNNKVDELCARAKFLSEYRTASVLCFTETWLKSETPNNHIEPDGFSVYRADRTAESGKELGTGGVCLFVNNRWCKNVTIKDKICTPKLELLVVSCRPYFLPREIPCVIFIIVYLPEGHHTPSEETILDVISTVQKDKPEAAIIVLGDFNQDHFKISGFNQYVNCTTRQDRTIDLCYCNINNSYNKCLKKDPLGISDHNNILLLPTYLCK